MVFPPQLRVMKVKLLPNRYHSLLNRCFFPGLIRMNQSSHRQQTEHLSVHVELARIVFPTMMFARKTEINSDRSLLNIYKRKTFVQIPPSSVVNT